jgi:predicted Fe-Mo cluster-binding NifX family protein
MGIKFTKNIEGENMKYAIPLSNGQLSQHFGQSKEFMLVDTDEQGKIIRKEILSTLSHNCGSLPKLLADQGVRVVLAGGMGFSPRMAFENRGIQVVLGVAETDPEKTVLAHMNLTLVSGQNVCEHGDEPCDHSHDHGEQHHRNCH